jgi:hypothetical protein
MKTKNGLLKLLAAVAAAAILVGCSEDDGDDFEILNGVWSRGDIVVTFNNSSGVFTQINSNSGWKEVQNNGSIRIGDKKFRNITGSNLKYTCQELTYNFGTVSGWEDCTITISADGQTLQANTPTTTNPITTYTRE